MGRKHVWDNAVATFRKYNTFIARGKMLSRFFLLTLQAKKDFLTNKITNEWHF